MRLLVDMNVSPRTADRLRAAGHDVVRVSSVLPHSATDERILDWARADMRVLVSHDLDFSALVALSGERFPSLITLRLPHAEPLAVADRLLQVLYATAEALSGGAAITVDERGFRVRQLPIT
jgi:predicted nuclease of predicted toxin-antitoxin system